MSDLQAPLVEEARALVDLLRGYHDVGVHLDDDGNSLQCPLDKPCIVLKAATALSALSDLEVDRERLRAYVERLTGALERIKHEDLNLVPGGAVHGCGLVASRALLEETP